MRASAAFCRALLPDDPRWVCDDAVVVPLAPHDELRPASPALAHSLSPINGDKFVPASSDSNLSLLTPGQQGLSPDNSSVVPRTLAAAGLPPRQANHLSASQSRLKTKLSIFGVSDASGAATAAVAARSASVSGAPPSMERSFVNRGQLGGASGIPGVGLPSVLSRSESVLGLSFSGAASPVLRSGAMVMPSLSPRSPGASSRGAPAPPVFLAEAAGPLALVGIGSFETYHIREVRVGSHPNPPPAA